MGGIEEPLVDESLAEPAVGGSADDDDDDDAPPRATPPPPISDAIDETIPPLPPPSSVLPRDVIAPPGGRDTLVKSDAARKNRPQRGHARDQITRG